MSGHNQHYLPQIIQKGFTNKYKGNSIASVFKGEKYEGSHSINKFGAEHLFNAENEDDSLLDCHITNSEKVVHGLIAKLRRNNKDTMNLQDNNTYKILNENEKKELNEYLFLSYLKTKSFRDKLSLNFDNLISDKIQFLELAKFYLDNHFDEFIKEIASSKELSAYLPIEEMKSPDNIENYFIFENILKDLVYKLISESDLSQQMIAITGDGCKKIHNEILMNVFCNKDVMNNFIKNKEIYIVKTDCDIILPDSIIMTIDLNGNYKSYIDKNTSAIFFPIGYNTYLLFSDEGYNSDCLDTKSLNKEFASISDDFFLCRKESLGTFEDLKGFIGSKSSILEKNELMESIKNNFKT